MIDYEKYYELQKNEAGEISGGWCNQMIDAFKSFVENVDKTSSILDIGCAYGIGVISIKNLGFTNVKGVDLIQEKIDYGKSKGADLYVGDIHNLPFEDGSFDYTFMSHTIEHSLDPIKAIEEMIRVTKIRGLIIAPLEDKNRNYNEITPHTSPIKNREYWDYTLSKIENVSFETFERKRLGIEYWSYFNK